MTQNERNHICEGLLIFATATERLMREYLNMEHVRLRGESKQMYNSMTSHIRSAMYYYSRFTDLTMEVLAQSDRNFKRVDDMRLDGDFMIRLFLRVINCNVHKFYNGNIEEGLQKLADKAQEEDGIEPEISEDVIRMFRMRICE